MMVHGQGAVLSSCPPLLACAQMSAIQERNADIASLHDKYGLQCMPRALIGKHPSSALPYTCCSPASTTKFTRL